MRFDRPCSIICWFSIQHNLQPWVLEEAWRVERSRWCRYWLKGHLADSCSRSETSDPNGSFLNLYSNKYRNLISISSDQMYNCELTELHYLHDLWSGALEACDFGSYWVLTIVTLELRYACSALRQWGCQITCTIHRLIRSFSLLSHMAFYSVSCRLCLIHQWSHHLVIPIFPDLQDGSNVQGAPSCAVPAVRDMAVLRRLGRALKIATTLRSQGYRGRRELF
jgi:hypothetical protein